MICWKLENSKNCPNNLQSSKVPAFHASPLIFMRMKQKHFVNFYSYNLPRTPPIVKIICVKNVRAKVSYGIGFFVEKEELCWKYEKDHRSCLLNSTANPAGFGLKWTELAVLFCRQLPNGSDDLFHIFSTILFSNWKKYPIEHFCTQIFVT